MLEEPLLGDDYGCSEDAYTAADFTDSGGGGGSGSGGSGSGGGGASAGRVGGGRRGRRAGPRWRRHLRNVSVLSVVAGASKALTGTVLVHSLVVVHSGSLWALLLAGLLLNLLLFGLFSAVEGCCLWAARRRATEWASAGLVTGRVEGGACCASRAQHGAAIHVAFWQVLGTALWAWANGRSPAWVRAVTSASGRWVARQPSQCRSDRWSCAHLHPSPRTSLLTPPPAPRPCTAVLVCLGVAGPTHMPCRTCRWRSFR